MYHASCINYHKFISESYTMDKMTEKTKNTNY